MRQSFRLRRSWWRLKLDPFVGPSLAGVAVLAVLEPWMGLTPCSVAVLLWAAFWAILEHVALKGRLQRWSRSLTPNFFAVRVAGCWRIFQRPAPSGSCKEILKELLADQRRLQEALVPGTYRTLTHDTILSRLRRMDNVAILSCKPAYVATLEDTISGATKGRCAKCSGPCPFPGRRQLRQFYDVRFLVQK